MEIILFIPFFIVASFLAFYIPGRVVIGQQKNLSRIGIFATSFILGIVLWGWQGYLFGFLQLRWLSYLYLLIFLVIFFKKKYYSFQIPEIKVRKWDFLTIFIAAVGIVAQVIPHFRSGEITPLGLFISDNNSLDHIWHGA